MPEYSVWGHIVAIRTWGNKVNLYVRIYRVGAVYVELSTFLDSKPLCSINRFGKEVVIDLPWTQLILTPWSRLTETGLPDDHFKHDSTLRSGGVQNGHTPPRPARPSEHRL